MLAITSARHDRLKVCHSTPSSFVSLFFHALRDVNFAKTRVLLITKERYKNVICCREACCVDRRE